MYCPEYVLLFGTHTAVTDHLCGGAISLVTYVAAGILAEILGISPTAMLFGAIDKRLQPEKYCCGVHLNQRTNLYNLLPA